MSSSHSGMASHISAPYKRKRPTDPVDPEDVEPPAKMLNTDSGPEGGLQEEGMSLAEHVSPLVDVEELKTHAKRRNIIVSCLPQYADQVINDIACWAFEESNLSGPMIAIFADDSAHLETYNFGAQRLLSTTEAFMAADQGHELAHSSSNGETGRYLLLSSPEEFLRLSLHEVQTITKSCALILYDTTILGMKNHQVFLQKITDICSYLEPSTVKPRFLALLQSMRLDDIQDPDITRLKSTFNAKLLRVAEFERGPLVFGDPPTELEVAYTSTHVQETSLCLRLREFDTTLPLDHHFRIANLVLHQLGPCAADLVWSNAFASSDWADDGLDNRGGTAEAQVHDLVKHWPFQLPNLDQTSRNMNVSHKFVLLVQQLEAHQILGDNFRGIIFVQKRIVAQLLVALIHILMPRLQFLRPLSLTNHRVLSDFETFERISQQFVSGEYNLLIATKSFEDVGLPKVPVVILFDVFESQISRAYARSCASVKGGHLIHMIEQGNSLHRYALSRSALDPEMLRWATTLENDYFSSAPPQPPQESNDPYNSDCEEDRDLEVVQDPITGHHIRKNQSTKTFYRYAARADAQTKCEVLFKFVSEKSTQNEWRCRINLAGTPVDGVSGPAAPTRALARKEACYIACLRLQHFGLLDSAFFFRTRARIVESHGEFFDCPVPHPGSIHERPHIPLTPDFWKNSILTSPSLRFLYPIVVSIPFPVSGVNEKAPICILTRAPLPPIPQFQLSHDGDVLTLQSQRHLPLSLDAGRLDLIHKFTIRFCRIIMNKPFEALSYKNLGYMFAPLRKPWKSPDDKGYDLSEDIDWEMVSVVSENWAVPFVDLTQLRKEIEDALIQDRSVEFTNRCEILCIREDMTPTSEVEGKGGKTLLEQCYSRRKNFEGLAHPNQPILEVMRMPAPTNYLNPPISQPELPAKTSQFLIPECCRRLTVSASTLRMGYLLPSIMRRIDEFLLVKQLNARFLNHCVKDELLIMATASPLAGNDYNYERLELLGDALLKYLSSTYVFLQNLNGTEGELHMARQKFISNRQLCDIVSSWGLPGYIQLKPFNIKSWLPPGMTIDDRQNESTVGGGVVGDGHLDMGPAQPNEDRIGASKRPKNKKRRLNKKTFLSPIANKTVADVAEAIIGAAYISGGRDAVLKATKALKIPFVDVEEWADFGRKASAPQLNIGHTPEPSAMHFIEKITGFRFQQPSLLRLTLTQNSMEMKDHQRLEFLGDAVLDFLVVRYLYDKDEHASPGELSVMKSLMVSNSFLAAICVWSGLHRFVHVRQQQKQAVWGYEKALRGREVAKTSSTGKEAARVTHFWMDLDVPKVLSDVIESIIGAAYISDDFSQSGVEVIFENMLLPFYEKYLFTKPDATSS